MLSPILNCLADLSPEEIAVISEKLAELMKAQNPLFFDVLAHGPSGTQLLKIWEDDLPKCIHLALLELGEALE